MDLALNNLQKFICHKTQQTKPNVCIYIEVNDGNEYDIEKQSTPKVMNLSQRNVNFKMFRF